MTAPGPFRCSHPFLLEKPSKMATETQAQVKTVKGQVGGGVIQAAHVSGFRNNFSKQLSDENCTKHAEGRATDCVAIYQPKGWWWEGL